MSGHSKWANIKRGKGIEDKKRGQIFSKMAKAIAVAIRDGGSADPEANSKLRVIIARAKAANMPKENVERALEKGNKREENLEGFSLEGYGPGGIGILIEVLSDNHQRSVQEIKNLFQRYGGNLAEPGSVSFLFEKRGMVRVKKVSEETMLKLLDQGVIDFKEDGEEVVVYIAPDKIENFKKDTSGLGVEIVDWDVVMYPKNKIDSNDPSQTKRFLEEIEEHEDVQQVFTNLSS